MRALCSQIIFADQTARGSRSDQIRPDYNCQIWSCKSWDQAMINTLYIWVSSAKGKKQYNSGTIHSNDSWWGIVIKSKYLHGYESMIHKVIQCCICVRHFRTLTTFVPQADLGKMHWEWGGQRPLDLLAHQMVWGQKFSWTSLMLAKDWSSAILIAGGIRS